VLWCPRCGTALAKAETGYIEQEGRLYHIDLSAEGRRLTIATTRPEMMPACVAVLVHPSDERYTSFIGKKARLPIFGREVPIIADDAVDREFGTGVVYTCTFGDEQDMAWQKKYKLPVIEAVDRRGRMTSVAGKYAGMKAEEARKAISEDLRQAGDIRKIDDVRHNVLCHVERSSCQSPIELLPMEQWFIRVRQSIPDIVSKAKEMHWYPGYMLQRLTDWNGGDGLGLDNIPSARLRDADTLLGVFVRRRGPGGCRGTPHRPARHDPEMSPMRRRRRRRDRRMRLLG